MMLLSRYFFVVIISFIGDGSSRRLTNAAMQIYEADALPIHLNTVRAVAKRFDDDNNQLLQIRRKMHSS